MACFLVPTAEAIVVTAVAVAMKAKTNNTPTLKAEGGKEHSHTEAKKAPFYAKLMWLANLLWGGAFLLAFEHMWHGEVVPWFPFLTAAADPADAAVMLHEMSTVGVTMAVLVTVVWVVMLIVSRSLEKREPKVQETASAA